MTNPRFVLQSNDNDEIDILPLPKKYISSHFHPQMEIYYVKKGSTIATINNKTQVVKKDNIVIAESLNEHSYEASPNTEGIYMAIPQKYLRAYNALMFNRRLSNNFILDRSVAKQFLFFINSAFEITKKTPFLPQDRLYLEGLVTAILGMLLRFIPTISEKNKKTNLMQEIICYIDTHFTESLYLEDVAKKFGYSKYYFSKIFNKNFLCGFSDYVNHVRCRNVISILNSTPNTTVLMAVLDSGFLSLSAFYKFFGKKYKISPSEVRNIKLTEIWGLKDLDSLHR